MNFSQKLVLVLDEDDNDNENVIKRDFSKFFFEIGSPTDEGNYGKPNELEVEEEMDCSGEDV